MSNQKTNITYDDFVTAVTYLKEGHEKQIGLIGGEPTLHPDITAMINYILDQKQTVQLFTNGIIEKSLVNQLKKYDPKDIYILVNLNDRHTYNDSQLNQIKYFFENCSNKIGLGYTIHHHTFDLSFHKEMTLNYHLRKTLRLGLASPIAGSENNDFLQENIFNALAQDIISNIELLEKDDILIKLDCGFFICLFTQDQLGIITQKTHGFDSKCGPVLDIDLDLNVHHCFSTTNYNKQPLNKFPDISYHENYFQELNKQLKFTALDGKCLMCKYFERGQCCGWCLGRIINS
jgi:MoaA/NifB/PqqE/SkfB family radical SAM enzyme